jgi:hypothetical protein
MPPNTKCVTRPGPWGNPYKLNEVVRTSKHAVKLFKFDYKAAKRLKEFGFLSGNPTGKHMAWIVDHIGELRGKNLACFCKVGDVCHADFLLKEANR